VPWQSAQYAGRHRRGVVGQIRAAVTGGAAAGGGDVGGMDVMSVATDILGSGIGGAVVMTVIGFLRNAVMEK
jgi:hypothetical protein